MAETPETSDHTSIKLRIQSLLNTDHPDYKEQPACIPLSATHGIIYLKVYPLSWPIISIW